MQVVDNVIQQETGYRPPSEQKQQSQTETAADSLDPFLSMEKTDVMLWVQVAQLVALYLILKEVRR